MLAVPGVGWGTLWEAQPGPDWVVVTAQVAAGPQAAHTAHTARAARGRRFTGFGLWQVWRGVAWRGD